MTTEIEPTTTAPAKPSWIVEELIADTDAQAKARAAAKVLEEKIKKPLPTTVIDGIIPTGIALKLIEILTGKEAGVEPIKIEMPHKDYEQVILMLSSTGDHYYRVTPRGCNCKGWKINHNCRHFRDAFPRLAKIGAITQRDIEDYTAYLHSDYAAWARKHHSPYRYYEFIELKRDLERIQNRLAELNDQKKFNKEYTDLEKVEQHLCEALGY